MINRRKLLKATAVGGSGLAALAYSPKPTLAASDWTANSPSQVSNSSGELSTLEITEDALTFELEYNGLGVRSHSIEFELEAKLESDSSYETVFSDSFEVEGDSGTATESKLSTSFPVDLLANTSLSASDFNESNAGNTNVTTVDLRASFAWNDGEYSASDSATSSFNVSVENTGPVIIDNFEDGDLSEYSEYVSGSNTYKDVVNSPVYNGSNSLFLNADNWDSILIESTSGLPVYPKPGDTVIAYLRIDNSGARHQLRFGGSNRNNCFAVELSYPDQMASIKKHESGSQSTLSDSSFSFNVNTWYKLEINWSTSGNIDFTVYDASSDSTMASVQATDGTYSSGSHISFENDDNNEAVGAYWDYVQKA
jgi:hypothetical protein